MSEFQLYSGRSVEVSATAAGLRVHISAPGAAASKIDLWPTPRTLTRKDAAVLADLQILLEQDLAQADGDDVLVTQADWVVAYELGTELLTRFSKPSHLLLAVDRVSEIGRPDFRYVQRWREGNRDVAVTRAGAYVRHDASGRIMHLDPRTVALLDGMDEFNNLPDVDRTKGASWSAFAKIREDAADSGAQLDDYLRSNTVIVPTTIGLTIRDHGDGSISFEPRVPEAANFAAKFMSRSDTDSVESLTDSDGKRVRILFSEPQLEVLRRMRRVRKIRGDDAARIAADPTAIFDGVADAIDLTQVGREYGPRVIGIGPLERPSNVRNGGGPSITGALGAGGHDGQSEDTHVQPQEQGSSRSSVSIDLLDADTHAPISFRLPDQLAIRDLRERIATALASGASEIEYLGHRVLVEEAILQTLDKHIASGNRDDRHDDGGEVGASGHLYLLINDHEESLTPALVVANEIDRAITTSQDFLPKSLCADVKLQSYQNDGVQWMSTCRAEEGRRGAVLADDMGLGKTLQLLTHIAYLVESDSLNDSPDQGANGPWRPVLIIAPLILVESGTWMEEMRKRFVDSGRVFEPVVVLRDEGLEKVRHASSSRDYLGKPLLDPARIMAHKVVITTYETLVAYQHSLAQTIGGRPLWSLVIFDEAQQVKSPSIKKSMAAKAVDAKFKIAATGTPVETRLRDLWNILDTVEPTRLGTQREFVRAYELPAQDTGDANIRTDALARLRTAIRYQRPGAYLLRRDKSILTFLPPKHEHRIRCEMTSAERDANHELLRTLRGPNRGRAALSVLQGLHLASQHPSLLRNSHDSPELDALLASSSRLTALVDTVRAIQAAGEKVLVFARSVPAQVMLSQVLGQTFSRRVDILNGETASDAGRGGARAGSTRRQLLERFRSSPGFGVIILSPFVAGVGLTLTEANHVVHYGRWWNPAVEGQATDRAYRIGQTKPVHVYYPILTDPTGEIAQTFDEALDTLITSRRTLASDFLSPVSEDDVANELIRALRSEVRDSQTSDKNS